MEITGARDGAQREKKEVARMEKGSVKHGSNHGTSVSPVPGQGDHSLTPGSEKREMRLAMKGNLNRRVLSMMNTCVHCGLCAEACHYYCSTGDRRLIPATKLERLSHLVDKHLWSPGSLFPFRGRGAPLDERVVEDVFRAAFEECTLCGKCALNCPMGINTGDVMSLGRSMLCSIERLPSGLIDPVKTSLAAGNFIGLSAKDFVETLEWLGEEMEDEVGEKGFRIPVDREGAEVLYVPHPLEIRDVVFLLMDAIKILHASGVDYTFSSHAFDTVNYAYYQGRKDMMMRVVQRTLDAREKLNAKSLVLAPCGHGYRAMRWEAEKYLGKRFSFPIYTLAAVIDRYIESGRIKLEKDRIRGPITYHDPCNLARRGGVIQAPRNVLNALTSGLVEMEPHGVLSYCCGGGGGLAATGAYRKKRMKMGRIKAEQIRKTGAKIVATNCFNCRTQIRDLSGEYDLGVEAKSIVELVAASLKE